MQFNHYGGEAALLAADLVNLPLSARLDEVAAVLRVHGVSEPDPTQQQAQRLLDWARQLAACFGCDNVQDQCQRVNSLLAIAASKPYISVHDGHDPHLHYSSLTTTSCPESRPSPPLAWPT